MVVAFRACSAGWLRIAALLVCVGCGSEPPAASADDVVFPAWTEPDARPTVATRKLQESANSSHAGIEANPNDAEHKQRRQRQLKANESTLLPKSSNSKFFGGCGAMGGKCTKEPPH